MLAINTYDEFGIPASTNVGRFQFSRGSRPSGGRGRPETQAWLPEAGLFYYKARMYSPTLGRFLQTDPIGYADGLNWYTYVGGDPVNYVDPLGLQDDHRTGGDVPKPICPPGDTCGPDITSNGSCRGKSCDGPVDAGPIGLVGFVSDGGRGGDGGGGSAGTPAAAGASKPLPPCIVAFLNRYYPRTNAGLVRIHYGGGGLPNMVGSTVTYNYNIYVSNRRVYDNPVRYSSHFFHEYTHVRQYQSGATIDNFIAGYIINGSHDDSPLEAQANANAAVLQDAFSHSPEARTCGKR